MEKFALLKDFAIIVVVAGVITLLFRRLRQPPYLAI
jgi:Kef-type K+ transport system membrane component KefB